MQSPGSVLARGEIAGVPLPAMTPRVAGAAAAARGGAAGAAGAPLPTNPSLLGGGAGRGAATPRQRQLFLHNPKLLTARGGMLAKPGELQAPLYLPYIFPTSPYISPISKPGELQAPLYLPYISPTSPYISPISKPGELQAQLTARGRRSGSEVTPHHEAPHISLYLQMVSPYISLYLPISPYISAPRGARRRRRRPVAPEGLAG